MFFTFNISLTIFYYLQNIRGAKCSYSKINALRRHSLMTNNKTKTNPAKTWYKLDNSGKLYPSVSSRKHSAMFRLSATMKNEVNGDLLQEAVDNIIKRFPTMNTHIRPGVFWYYKEENKARLLIEHKDSFPTSNINWRKKYTHPLNVTYSDKKIMIDFFHAITDGHGGMVFFKTLIGEYLRLCGVDIPYASGVLDPSTSPNQEELEDAVTKMPLPKKAKRIFENPAYRFPTGKANKRQTSLITYTLSASRLKEKAKQLTVSVNDYIVGALLYIGYKEQLKDHHHKMQPVRVSVPVNMRRFFPNESVRNCSWIVHPKIVPPYEDFTFEKAVLVTKAFMQEALIPENLYKGIAPNLLIEKNIFLRMMPLFIKNILIKAVYKAIMAKSSTTTLSNLGIFVAPLEMMRHIDFIDFTLSETKDPGVIASFVTTNDTLRLAFISNQENHILANEFATLLEQLNIMFTKEVIINEPK